MLDCHDQRHPAAGIVADKMRALNFEMIHQAYDHRCLSEKRAIEEIALVGIPVAEKIWSEDTKVRAKQWDHVIVEIRPSRDAVQKNNGIA